MKSKYSILFLTALLSLFSLVVTAQTINNTENVSVKAENSRSDSKTTIICNPDVEEATIENSNKNHSIYKNKPKYGQGTKSNPYRITTAEELRWFADLVNGDFAGEEKDSTACALIMNDIDLSSVCGENIGNWSPIGREEKKRIFSGMLDGGNHTIKGLYYFNTYRPYVGLIGLAKGAEIKNIRLIDSEITGKGSVAGICGGGSYSTKITNCFSSATVTANDQFAGGIVGYFGANSTLSKCYNDGTITAHQRSAGGICGGLASKSIIRDCYNTGHIIADSEGRAGGIVGSLDYSGKVENCHSVGSISCTHQLILGSIVGFAQGTDFSIANCYYLNQSDSEDGTYLMTKTQFKNGEVLSLLGQAWAQNIKEDDYPKLIQDNVDTYKNPILKKRKKLGSRQK